MNPRADGANRTLLTLLALLLLAAAVLGLLLSFGWFGAAAARQPVLFPAARHFADRNEGWFWPAVAVAAVVLGLLAIRWLMAQFGTDRIGELDLEPDPDDGATTVHSSAVTDAVSDEVEGYRGVERGSARLVGGERDPDLVLAVTVDERADLGAVRRRIEQQAVAHVRQALGRPALPVRLQIQLARGPGRRLR